MGATMSVSLLPLRTLGAVESNGTVTFGLWLPWVSAADGNALTVKIIHEQDQFLQGVAPRVAFLHGDERRRLFVSFRADVDLWTFDAGHWPTTEQHRS
jgi:hypothetical protein